MTGEFWRWTATKRAQAIRTREVSSHEVADAADVIEARGGVLTPVYALDEIRVMSRKWM